MLKRYYTLIAFLVLFNFSWGQEALLQQVEEYHEVGAYTEAQPILTQIDTAGFDKIKRGKFLYHTALSKINIDAKLVEAYQILLGAKKIVQQNDLAFLFDINDELIYTQLALSSIDENIEALMEENFAIAQELNDPNLLIGCNEYRFYQIERDDPDQHAKQIALFRNSLEIAQKNNLDVQYGNNLINLASVHDNAAQYDSALVYYEKAKDYVRTKDYLPTKIGYYNNLGNTYKNLERYKYAIDTYLEGLQWSNQHETNYLRGVLLANLANAYEQNEDFENGLQTFKKYLNHVDSLDQVERHKAIQELEAKYQVQERKLENAELSAENERQKTMTIAIAGSAFTLLLISGFIYNNQRKKKRLALQEAELEKQRADNLMKNQELATIDAMISGQEKERKRLAQELHDNLGSSLTTIRLYFENLKTHFKEETSTEIYSRTDKLLEETYSTIRSMSHNRHNGVLASKGLIPSLEKLGKNLTDSGRIKVYIHHHGMNRKLENSLELNIFRMLQELLNNVIKHAKATSTTLNIVGTDDAISLMIEDNGRGFTLAKHKENEGMGLYSIEKRIEEMGGTMDIDSSPGNGTTISIDIPIL